MQCLLRCRELVTQGCSVLFFPEGTRSKDGKVDTWKNGAFAVAVKERVPVVPITLDGSGPCMPNGRELEFWPGKVRGATPFFRAPARLADRPAPLPGPLLRSGSRSTSRSR